MKPKINLLIIFIGIIVLFCLFLYFKKQGTVLLFVNKNAEQNVVVQTEKTTEQTKTPENKEPVQVSYTTLTIKTNPRKEIIDAVGKENVDMVLALNRININKIQKGAVLTVPVSWVGVDMLELSPYPAYIDRIKNISKFIFVSQRVQAFGLYENGHLVRWGPVSTGKSSTPTPSKLYFANWKQKVTISNIDDTWVMPWNVNFANFDGMSLHQYELPGYAASHSCVRLFEEDAKFIYGWVNQWTLTPKDEIATYGTPILIFGKYGYGQKPLWKKLSEDPNATTITDSEINEQLDPYLPEVENKKLTSDIVKVEPSTQ
ncbi:MAG: L,D-transpeptidase [Minisyncoccia bacterium]